MTQALERDTTGSSGRRQGSVSARARSTPRSTRGKLVPIGLQLLAMVGIGALVYSSAADWFAELGHEAAVSGYVEAVNRLPGDEIETRLAVAREYNAHMPQGVLRDPYSTDSGEVERDSAYRAYQNVLRVSDNRVIGQLSYPRLDISLPVYHGTSESVISRGVGHLYGSSLPVGGPSTHSVLTSHSGLLNASLFTDLPDASIGDVFQLTVLGEAYRYRVSSIKTIEPEDTGLLRIVEGKDMVTLITCTPIGINSHRLLVTGERIATPDESGVTALSGDDRTAGFPWWAVWFVGGSGLSAYLLFVPPKSRRRGIRDEAHR